MECARKPCSRFGDGSSRTVALVLMMAIIGISLPLQAAALDVLVVNNSTLTVIVTLNAAVSVTNGISVTVGANVEVTVSVDAIITSADQLVVLIVLNVETGRFVTVTLSISAIGVVRITPEAIVTVAPLGGGGDPTIVGPLI